MVQPRFESTVKQALKTTLLSLSKPASTSSDNLTKYELKEKLYEMMFQSASYHTHDDHRDLYNALAKSIEIDTLQARHESAQPSHKKRSHDDQDPSKNYDEENEKRRRKDTGGSSLKKGKAPANLSNFERFADTDEPQQQDQETPIEVFRGKHAILFMKPNEKKIVDVPEQRWFNKLVDADKDRGKHELQIGSIVMFA
ncbi:hypothetical protein Tco_0274602, partial [Tanacetum coccineum]